MNRKINNSALKAWSFLTAASLLSAPLACSAQNSTKAQPTQVQKTASAQTQSKTPGSNDKNQPQQVQPTQSNAAQVDLVALAGPTQITHTGNAWRSNMSTVSLKSGQEILPLTMTLNNGNEGKLKLKGIRIFINGRKILTEADFKGKDSVSLNMSDILTAGDTQMEVQTYGNTGSTLTWVVTTPKIKVSDIKPDTAAPGDKVVINGKNLPKAIAAYQLQIGSKTATITGVTDKQINFTVPQGVEGGKQTVTLTIAGVKCDALTLKIKAQAEMSGTNMVECPPSTPLIIYGKGFAKSASDNTVTFNGVTASVTRVTDTSLEVVVPSLDFPQAGVEIKLKTNGMDAKNSIKIDLSMRTIPKGESLSPGGTVFQQ